MSLRILFVTPYVPSKFRTRPYSFIRELTRLGHRVTLVCLLQPAWEESYLNEVAPFCEAIYPVHLQHIQPYLNAFSSFFTRLPLSVAYCLSPELNRTVRELLSQNSFDLIHTEFVRAAPATLDLKGIPKLFDAVDSLTLTYRRSISAARITPKQRFVSLIEWFKMRRYEPWVIRHYDRTIISSPIDQLALQSKDKTVDVIVNGVDLDYFKFYDGSRQASTIVFLGKMSYYVNVASVLWFYKKVFPKIRRRRPDVIFKIVGRDPIPVITRLGKDPSVEVTGTVPDVRIYLSQASLSISPMVSGGGMQFKMLEAMAMGTPCVATRLACSPLQTSPGRDVIVADSPDEFATAVCELLDDPIKRSELAVNGRQYVEKFHNWTDRARQLNQLYEDMFR
jgi:glycosyltransferase involved in cell wall biosynthesis